MNTWSVNYVLSRGIRRNDSRFQSNYNVAEMYRRKQLRQEDERRAQIEQERILQESRGAARLAEARKQDARRLDPKTTPRAPPTPDDLFKTLQNLRSGPSGPPTAEEFRQTIREDLQANRVMQMLQLLG